MPRNLNSNTKSKYLAYFIKTLGSKGGGGAWHRAPHPWLRPCNEEFYDASNVNNVSPELSHNSFLAKVYKLSSRSSCRNFITKIIDK